LKSTEDIVPNWMISSPDPNVTIGHFCKPFKIEMVIRGYLTGHAWRTYKLGKREICGVKMPDGMVEHQKFPTPIITPSTKADFGHDEDISREDILRKGIVEEKDYLKLEEYTRAVFQRGSEMADERGLILVDTKYEFGKKDGKIFLIDEIHTPDSSRYFYKEGYLERQENGEPQKQLSKEFVREWLMENGFQGKDGQKIPEMNKEFVKSVSERYIELFEKVSGTKFEKPELENPHERIEKNILKFFK
jgi:phosphoribosylaminoimidazole-succinocarboxamide synthase